MTKSRRRISQHEDLLTDPQYRHLVHKTKKQALHRQQEREWKRELEDYCKHEETDPSPED